MSLVAEATSSIGIFHPMTFAFLRLKVSSTPCEVSAEIFSGETPPNTFITFSAALVPCSAGSAEREITAYKILSVKKQRGSSACQQSMIAAMPSAQLNPG
jgi:hypothetical protein